MLYIKYFNNACTVIYSLTESFFAEFLIQSATYTSTRHLDKTTQRISKSDRKIHYGNSENGRTVISDTILDNIRVLNSGDRDTQSKLDSVESVMGAIVSKIYRTSIPPIQRTLTPNKNDNKLLQTVNETKLKTADFLNNETKFDNRSSSTSTNTTIGTDLISNEVPYPSTTNPSGSSSREVVTNWSDVDNKTVKPEVISSDKSNTTKLLSNKVQVIILTQKRSGSSFMGEIFNQNADFTYFFEPLSSMSTRLMKRLVKGDFTRYAKQILNGILQGDFTDMPEGWWSFHVPRETCKSLNLRPLVKLCGKSGPKKRSPKLSLLEKMKLLGKYTKNSKHIAIKTIRLQDMKLLKDFLTDSSLNVKILHLVRDPRGVINSRSRLREPNYDLIRRKGKGADEVQDLCDHMERNLKYQDTEWLRERYKIIRYEDAAEQPLKVASEIYHFLGLELPLSVNNWLQVNTNHSAGTAFSITRDSKKAAHAWRSQIDYRKVTDIQKKCPYPMAFMGYLPLNKIFDLRNLKIRTLGNIKNLDYMVNCFSTDRKDSKTPQPICKY